jgi:hypothetical protein
MPFFSIVFFCTLLYLPIIVIIIPKEKGSLGTYTFWIPFRNNTNQV